MADDVDLSGELRTVLGRSVSERLAGLVAFGRRLLSGNVNGDVRTRTAAALCGLLEEGLGDAHERLEAGEILGWLGDPRVRRPQDADYWADVTTDDGPLKIGRFPVTNLEFREFVEGGGYQNRRFWNDEGWSWLQACEDPWPVRCKADDAGPFIVPNQPVVGASWYEAEAFATFHSSRLPRFDERRRVVRGDGPEKRHYPWGSPFGEGSANTREEVLGRPCAVGLYLRDVTPDGVHDLAGNVAEWAGDGHGDERWYSPGAWSQPSMASWAKAREIEWTGHRAAWLGFRLAHDLS